MEPFFYDKENNLVSISNAILKHFTGECFHAPHKQLEALLAEKRYNKVVVMLFDGLGKSIREAHLKDSDFLMRKKAFEVTSIFPPTTVACTTAIQTGKYPVETGWLGWKQYFKNHGVIVDMFTNNNSITGDHINGPRLADVYCPYQTIFDLINKKGITAKAIHPKPIEPDGPQTLDEFFEVANIYMKKKEPHYYYMYWGGPDHEIHEHGINHRIIKNLVKDINRKLVKLAKENKDNLIIVLADHSLVETKFFDIEEHKDFLDTLETLCSLDSRSACFHLKSGMSSHFEELFKKYYGDYFKLYTKQEVIDLKLFGEGEEHPLFREFLGDYLATSISEYGFNYRDSHPMIGAHSGSLKEEFIIDVSILNK